MNDAEATSLREELRDARYRIAAERIAVEAGRDPRMFDELLRLTFDADRAVSWHALWACEKLAAAEPARFAPHADALIEHLFACRHAGSRRLLLSILLRVPFETLPVGLLDWCLDRMLLPAEAPAVQALAVKTAYRLCGLEPALFGELQFLLEEADTACYAPAARAALRNTLAQLQRRSVRR